jgi:hypothetical protein
MPEFYESRRLRYEIHKLCDKRWEIAEVVGDGREALAERRFDRTDFEGVERAVLGKANALLAGGEIQAVRVLREREREDGFRTTSEIFFREASGARPEAPVGVSRYDGPVPPCASAEELYERPACKAIGTLLRGWLDKQVITALELLHLHPYIRKLNDSYSLVQGALHQVATAQVKEAGGDLKTRLAALQEHIAAVEAKAREAMAEKRLPTIGDDLGDFAKRIAARYEGAQRRFFAMVAFARRFQGSPSLFTRLEFALDALAGDAPPDLAPLLDDLAAGCLDSSQLVMDLLGHQPNLAAALRALAELASGRGETTSGAAATAKLRQLIGAGRLPMVVDGLWDRVVREFARGRPLSRSDERREWGLLIKTSEDLLALAPAGYDAAIAEATRLRMRRIREAASP